MASVLLAFQRTEKILKKFFIDASYVRDNTGIIQDYDVKLILEVMTVIKYYAHDPEILRLTSEHEVVAVNVPVDLTKRDESLDQLRDRALADGSRGAVLDYWQVFLAQYSAGDIDYDVDGLFRPEFDITYED